MRRFLLISAAVVAGLFLAASIVLWVFLSAWVPTKGKALLVRAIEQRAPVTVSIEAMRYEWFRGLLLEQIRIVDRASQETWLSTPLLRAQPQWLPLALGYVAVTAHAPLEAPCRTDLSLLGRYHLGTKGLTVDMRTGDVTLSSVAAPLKRFVPTPLVEGSVQLTLHAAQQRDRPLSVSGRLTGTQLVWRTPTLQGQADLAVNGSATAGQHPGETWSVDALISLHRGRLDGLPMVNSITELDGTARLTQEQLDIERLEGTTLGSRWRLEGALAPLTHPSVEALISSRVELARLSEAWGRDDPSWHIAGEADLRGVCRGPLQPTPLLDCLLHADVREAALTGTRFTRPMTQVSGSLDYDVLARQLVIARLSGRIHDEPVSADGTITWTPAVFLSLAVNGTLPLDAVMGWLPAGNPVSQLSGRASADLQIQGPLARLQPRGRVELRDAGARFAKAPHVIDRVNGLILLRKDQINLNALTLRLNEQPMTLTALVTPGDIPRGVATLELPQGRAQLTARLTPEALIIEEGHVAVGASRLEISGALSRREARPHTLRLSGTVELADLTTLPFLPLPGLAAWRLQGPATVTAQFEGPLTDWPSASMQASLRAQALRVRDVPVAQLACELEQRHRVLRLRVPSALVADGRLVADVALEHGATTSTYMLQADLVNLQLARLTEAIPAWRNRQVSGSASAHALLSGTWQQRASWRGEGWVHGTGEGLGKVPLLDKVFQGLFGVLADRLGLDTLRRAEITEASVQWRLSQERFSTEDLRLGGLAGMEPVAIYANGSVGLDQTLDFVIEPEFSEGMVLQAPGTSTIASTILKAAGQLERLRRLIGRHRLTGTLAKPEYRFEVSRQEVFKQLSPAPGDLLQNLLDVIR